MLVLNVKAFEWSINYSAVLLLVDWAHEVVLDVEGIVLAAYHWNNFNGCPEFFYIFFNLLPWNSFQILGFPSVLRWLPPDSHTIVVPEKLFWSTYAGV
jgi:hypothetical protein